MKYHLNKAEKYSLATIVQSGTKTVSALISIDIHDEHTLENEIAELMYPDALLSGTKNFTRDEFLNAVNLLGASLSVTIQAGIATISLKSREEHFSKLLKLVEEMLLYPAFSNKEMFRIKTTVSNELEESKEDSKAIAFIGLQNTIYGFSDRKYSSSIEEQLEAIDSINMSHLKKLHNRVLSQPWVSSATGTKKECDLLEKVIKKVKAKAKLTDLSAVHQQKPPRPGIVLKNIPSRTNIDFSIGAPLPISMHHPDFIPLSLGLAVLGKWGGFSGRLMSTVRELEGLTYGIYSRLEGFYKNEQGYWRIMTFFAPDKAVTGLTSSYREITKLYKDGVSQAELDKFKVIMNTQQVLLNDSISSLLGDFHSFQMNGFSIEEMKLYKERIHTVTLDEVNSAIKMYLDPKNLTISGAGPTKAVQKELQKFSKNVS